MEFQDDQTWPRLLQRIPGLLMPLPTPQGIPGAFFTAGSAIPDDGDPSIAHITGTTPSTKHSQGTARGADGTRMPILESVHLSDVRSQHGSRPSDVLLTEQTRQGEGQVSDRIKRCTHLPGRGFSVLSFDGGGRRGYISLLILKRLLRQLQPAGKIYPYLYFDLICGTSTGGLITILLGVLHLDIDTAIEQYRKLVQTTFATGFSYLRYLAKDSGYSTGPLKGAIAEILKEYGEGRTLMRDHDKDMGCRCFVTTAYCYGEQRDVLVIRSYQLPEDAESIPSGYEWTCEDAALATTAAPGYFARHAVALGRHEYLFEDAGAHRVNNPARLALEESQKLGGAGNALFISIGTGTRKTNTPPSSWLPGLCRNKIATIKALLRHATDVEPVDRWMADKTKYSNMSYFRLTPPLHERIGLDDCSKIATMEGIVRRYFLDNHEKFENCARRLKEFQM